MIKAEIIADSANEFGNRLTTFVVTFPRYILAELNTHRMFSRNSASSRAIPFEKMLKSVEDNPFIPMAWQKDHKGMQGTEYFTDESKVTSLKAHWLLARDFAIERAKALSSFELTKQLCNRILEPFMWHTAIISATNLENFFTLRCPQYLPRELNQLGNFPFRSKKDCIKEANNHQKYKSTIDDFSLLQWLGCNKGQADIHIMALAEAMYDAYQESTTKELKAGEWHIPFGDNINIDVLNQFLLREVYNESNLLQGSDNIYTTKVKIATAMCARVSYTVFGEENKAPNYENDIKLHDRLATSGHWSPFEHCAKAMNDNEYSDLYGIAHPKAVNGYERGWSGNFRGFIQYRKLFDNENITK